MLPAWLSPAVAWFLLGVVLLLVELATPGFIAIFFAFGCWMAALAIGVGLVDRFDVSLLIFLTFSIASLVLLRRRMAPVVRGNAGMTRNTDLDLDDFVGRRAVVIEAVNAAQNRGRIEFRGTLWEARSSEPIAAGATVEITSRDNLTLYVRPVKE